MILSTGSCLSPWSPVSQTQKVLAVHYAIYNLRPRNESGLLKVNCDYCNNYLNRTFADCLVISLCAKEVFVCRFSAADL